MLLGPSDCPRLRFNVLSIDYVRITNCFYDIIIFAFIRQVAPLPARWLYKTSATS